MDGRISKNQCHIQLQKTLVIGNIFDNEDKRVYQLLSIIQHLGSSFEGHYITYRRIEDDKWAKISDASVSYCTWKSLQESAQVYILLYEQIN